MTSQKLRISPVEPSYRTGHPLALHVSTYLSNVSATPHRTAPTSALTQHALWARVRLSKFTIGAGIKILASSAHTRAGTWLKPPAGRELQADKLVGENACLDDDRR